VAELDQLAQQSRTASLLSKEGTDLLQRKYNVLKEENEALKQGGAMIPTQLETAIARVNAELEASSQEHVASITELTTKMSTMSAELLRHRLDQETMKRELTESKSSKEKIEAKNANTSQHAFTIETELETVRQENSTLKSEIVQLKEILKQSETEKTQLIIKMKKENHSILISVAEKNSFESKIEEFKSKFRNSQTELRTAKDKLIATERSLNTELAKSATQGKKLDQQTTRLKDVDARVVELQKANVALEVARDVSESVAEQFNQRNQELEKKLKRLEDENERMKMRPSNKIFKPVQNSVLVAFTEKIDFTKVQLRNTASKYLEDARKESVLLEVENRERTTSLSRPQTPVMGSSPKTKLPTPNFDTSHL